MHEKTRKKLTFPILLGFLATLGIPFVVNECQRTQGVVPVDTGKSIPPQVFAEETPVDFGPKPHDIPSNCRMINTPDASNFNDKLPRINNAFRAADNMGDPGFSKLPYEIIYGPDSGKSGSVTVYSWDQFMEAFHETNNGDLICAIDP